MHFENYARKNGLFRAVPDELWNDWHWQVKNRVETLEDLKKYVNLTEVEEEGGRRTLGHLRMAITPYYLSLIDLNYNNEDWTAKDGYWYYNTPVAPGGVTEPLFTTVAFDISMGNQYQNSTAEIDVSAQAVQTANNGTASTDAQGWPAD